MAGAERRRSRPCWRARASGARRLARVPRSAAERAVAPQAGCARVHRGGHARAGSGRSGASFHDSNQNETNGNATFTTTIDFTASDGSVAAGHDTTHLLWNGVPDPEDPNAI